MGVISGGGELPLPEAHTFDFDCIRFGLCHWFGSDLRRLFAFGRLQWSCCSPQGATGRQLGVGHRSPRDHAFHGSPGFRYGGSVRYGGSAPLFFRGFVYRASLPNASWAWLLQLSFSGPPPTPIVFRVFVGAAVSTVVAKLGGPKVELS